MKILTWSCSPVRRPATRRCAPRARRRHRGPGGHRRRPQPVPELPGRRRSPTVFVIPGKGSYAEAWNAAVPPDDPIRSSPYDLIEEAKIGPSPVSAQPLVAKTTRICTYDRPNTRPDGTDRSTPVAAAAHRAVRRRRRGETDCRGRSSDADGVRRALVRRAGPRPARAATPGTGQRAGVLRTHLGVPLGPRQARPERGVQHRRPDRRCRGGGDPRRGRVRDHCRRPAATARARDRAQRATSSPQPSALKPDNYTQAQIHQANDMLAAALGTTNVIVPGTRAQPDALPTAGHC